MSWRYFYRTKKTVEAKRKSTYKHRYRVQKTRTRTDTRTKTNKKKRVTKQKEEKSTLDIAMCVFEQWEKRHEEMTEKEMEKKEATNHAEIMLYT